MTTQATAALTDDRRRMVGWRRLCEKTGKRSLRERRNVILPGQYFDAETGLNYNYRRDYDPATGRYVESDPIGLHGGINTYAYVDSTPVDTVDPFGLTPAGLLGALLNTLPKREDCNQTDWDFCTAKCAPARALGCYVTLSWKLKGVRGEEARTIRSRQRNVECNCEELECTNPAPKKGGANPPLSTPPYYGLPWWARVPISP